MLEWLYLTIRVILCPKCWFLPWKINKTWDKRLRMYLEVGDMEAYSHDPGAKYCIMLGGRQVIITDFPRNFGTRVNGASVGHPSRKTMFRLLDQLEDFRLYGQSDN